jgi:peptidoglycan/LPS O-acetylase OafA/YrhL
MLTHGDYLATRRFPALDGVRAIAAVLVVFFHYGGPQWVLAHGWVGVHAFFVLSGYLITTLALREESRDGRMSIANFYIRRAFRILPVYYVILAIVVGLYWLRGQYHSSGLSGAVPYYLTFLNEFHPNKPFGQAWTLGIEQKFYLLWPFLAFGVGALTFARRLCLAIGLVVLLLLSIPFLPYAGAYSPILIGCALAITMHSAQGFRVLRPLTHPACGVVLLAAVAVLQIHLGDIEAALRDGGVTGVTCYSVLIALLIPSLVAGGPVARLLSLAPFRFVGERSYSLYLLQGVAAIAVAATIPQLAPHRTLTAVAVTLAAMAMADLLYRWVELPMIEVGRRIVKLRRVRGLRPHILEVPADARTVPAASEAGAASR